MTNYVPCLMLQRVVVPLIIVLCSVVRPVGIALAYLFMFFITPFVPVANSRNIKGPVGAYFIILIALSTILLVGHIGLQIAVAVLGRENVMGECTFTVILLRHIGFISLDNLHALAITEWIGPDVVMFLTSIIVYVLLRKLTREEVPSEQLTTDGTNNGHHIEEGIVESRRKAEQLTQATMENMKKIGPLFSLITLFLASAFRPSVPGGFYFLVFISTATYWACFKPLQRGFAIILRFVMVVLVIHVIAILSYQTPWPQDQIANSTLAARLTALEPLFISKCNVNNQSEDIRIIDFNRDVEFDSYLSPISMLLCYYVLALTSSVLMKKKVLLHRDSSSEPPTERTPLVRRNTKRQSAKRSGSTEQKGSEISGAIPLDALAEPTEDQEQASSIFDQILFGIYSTGGFIYQNSYIFTNITMMVWSIIYHSWLTFLLLIWANILWMIPNQRKTMLRTSPFIVLYAELLLIAQYIYGMNLTDDELPSVVQAKGINLRQIGFIKPDKLPCVPLINKTLFTTMFWITLRQLFKEEKEKKQSSTLADMVAPLQITVGAATADLAPKPDTKKSSKFLEKTGQVIKTVLVKLWIWLLISVIFLSAITGQKMTVFRICYMALFLFFVLAFQLSWKAWTKIMYGFWLVLIFYGMSILLLVYTYQFDKFPEYWHKYLHIGTVLQEDIGLKEYETKDLFLHLVNPTAIVIMTVIQVHYFHKRFLASLETAGTTDVSPVSNTTSANFGPRSDDGITPDEPPAIASAPAITEKEAIEESELEESGNLGRLSSFRRKSRRQIGTFFQKVRNSNKEFIEFIWVLLEVHLLKIVYICAFVCCVTEVCVLHICFAFLSVIALMSKTKAQIYISRLIGVIVSALLLSKMIYQIDYIKHSEYNVTCDNDATDYLPNKMNNADWFGLQKLAQEKLGNLSSLFKGYILYMVILTAHAVVVFRQANMRARRGVPNIRPHLIFPGIIRKDAEKDLLGLIQYLFNYGYYKFGIEVTLITLVSLISYRQDVIAILYAVWLCILFMIKRETCAKFWPAFQWFTAVIIPLQYLLFVGLPPGLCLLYPWHDSPLLSGLQSWAMLPGPHLSEQSKKLLFDFMLLLFICRQSRVFSLEKRFEATSTEFPGGTNKSIIAEIENLGVIPFENPTPDFIANVRNWLDILKVAILTGFFWFTLAVVFLAGTNIVSLFSIGYLVGSFVFLWQGTDFYLRPIGKIVKWWYILLAYNVAVIAIKTTLQIAGCLFLSPLKQNVCWFVHFMGVSCIRDLLHKGDILDVPDPTQCPSSMDVTGLTWDAICFAFLLLQLRIFKSYYFCHIINDTKASTILASRGAELIEDLRRKQIQFKAKHEREVLRKIKKKMEKIRATQQKMMRPIDKPTHFDAIRAGDYYMFDDLDEKIELDLMDEESDFLEAQGEISASELKMSKRKNLLEHEKDEKSEKTPKTPEKPVPSTSKGPPSDDSKKKSDAEGQQSGLDSKEEKAEEEAGLIPRLIEGLLVSFAIRLNRLSRNYRYVMKILANEKKLVKESEGFGIGARTGAGAIWTPFRFLQKPASSDGEPSNTLSSQTDTNEHIHDSQKQLESGFDAETGTKTITIEQDPDTKDTTDRQELQALGGMFKQDKEDIDDFEDDFTTRDHHILIEILIALWYAVLSNTDIVCYSVLFVKQVASSSILSLPLPFMVFLWGTLALPRPTKTFWVTLIAYTQAVVLLKCVFQFGVIWLNSPTPDYKNQQLSFSKLFEIEYRENYAAYDLVLLLVLFFHRFVLKSQGLWKSDYKKETIPEGDYVLKDDTEDLGSSQEASETAVISKGDETLILAKPPENGAQSTSDIPIHVENVIEESGNYLPEVVKITSAKYFSSLIDFFKDLIQKPRLPTDVYALLFLCDFINFFILLFGFASFGSQQGDGGVQAYLEENKIPVPFLIMLLLQFLLIIIDRALYLRKSLVYKVIFHFLSVIGIHIWMFFIIPAVTEAKFNSLMPPVIFYVIKCIYFLFSSYQIRCGYPTRILGNFLTKSYSLVNMIAYKLYMNIPFLFELRTFMDWVCTDTTMTLFDWLKMEDIFACIYGLKCGRQMESDLPSPRAQKKGLLVKIFMGGTAILSLIVIIWGPLALFALGNTVGIANIPYDVTVSLKVGPYEPVYQMSAQDTGIHAFDDGMMDKFYSTYTWNKSALTFVSGYDSDDVAAVVLGANSTALWNISPPDRERLLHDLKQDQTLTWRLKYTISRISHDNKDDPGVKQDEKTYLMDKLDPNRLLLLQMLEGNITTNESVILPRLLPKFLKVKNIGALKTVPQLMPENEQLRNLKIRFFMGGYQNMDTWWEIKEDCDDDFYKNYLSKLPLSSCDSTVVIYTFNDKKFPSSVSLFTAGGIFGLYASLVYVISRVFRSVISGAHRSIMFEDLPYVDRVLQLCLDIYLVREAMEFSLEEDLFAKLLFLYRSPETMIKWTRPKEEATDDETEETESVRSRASSRRRPE